jgi:hypothetical protein
MVGPGPAREEHGGARHVVVTAESAQRGRRRDPVADRIESVRHHLRWERTRCHRVHRNVLRTQFPRKHSGELMQRRFATGVRIIGRLGNVNGGNAANIDNSRGIVRVTRAAKCG